MRIIAVLILLATCFVFTANADSKWPATEMKRECIAENVAKDLTFDGVPNQEKNNRDLVSVHLYGLKTFDGSYESTIDECIYWKIALTLVPNKLTGSKWDDQLKLIYFLQ
jgi:hypothetical protein